MSPALATGSAAQALAVRSLPETARLVARALAAASLPERRAEAARALSDLSRSGAGQRLLRSLSACLDGSASIERTSQAYILYDSHEPDRRSAAESALAALNDRAAAYFGLPSPPLLVDVRRAYDGISHCIHEIDGRGHIVVSGQCEQEEILAVVAHELAHCHFRCGNRFLDEGLAVHFETAHVSHHNFPAAVSGMDALLAAGSELAPLQALLRWRSEDVLPTFSPSRHGASLTVYAQAWKLIDSWLSRLGRERTLEACRTIGAQSDEGLEATFLRSTGRSIEDTHMSLFGRPPSVNTGSVPSIHLVGHATSGVDETTESTTDCDHDESKLREQIKHSPGDRRLSLHLAKTILRRLLTYPEGACIHPQVNALLDEVDALIAPEFRASAPGAHALLLRAWRNTVCMMSQPDRLKCYRALGRAIADYEAALAILPNDPEILTAAGTFFLSLPQSAGGRPDFARRCLELAFAARSAQGVSVNID